jgi:hypothetical protein
MPRPNNFATTGSDPRSSGMRIKYQILLVATLALAAQPLPGDRVLAQGKEKPVKAPIQTDKKTYKVTITSQSVKFTINYSYVNRTGDDVILPVCMRPYPPSVQKKIKGRWTPVFLTLIGMCRSPPVWIKPGGTYQETYEVEAFLPGNNIGPKLEIDVREIEGVYRLEHSFSRRNYQPLPLEGRISNEFELTK